MPAPPHPPRLRVGFILAHRFTLCAFASFVDVLRLAADEGDRSRPILCSWTVIGATLDPVRSSAGLAIRPDARLGDPSRFDYLVVVGGLIGAIERLHPDCIGFLRRAAAAGVPLVGLCTGAFILHRARLMDGYRCCVSWFHHGDFLEQFEGLRPVADRIFVVDRDRLTCSGGASSAHLAAHLVERHVGHAAAMKSLRIARHAAHGRRARPQPRGRPPQAGAPLRPGARPLAGRGGEVDPPRPRALPARGRPPLGRAGRRGDWLLRRLAPDPRLPRPRGHDPDAYRRRARQALAAGAG
jgi:transcriptional regulator GlxA family with amidase domain